MIRHACYKFVGTDKTNHLSRRKKYYLMVYEFNFFERIFGNYPYSWKVIAYRPYDESTPIYPYSSWEDFDQNWTKQSNNKCKDVVPKTLTF